MLLGARKGPLGPWFKKIVFWGANEALIVRWNIKSVDCHVPTIVLNPIWVTEALSRPQKGPNIVLNGKFS